MGIFQILGSLISIPILLLYGVGNWAAEINKKTFMNIFNAIQIVAIMMGLPSLLAFLSTATFAAANVAFWITLIIGFIMAIWVVVMVASALEDS